MDNFDFYTPKVNHEVPERISIADLIPVGRDKAISRKDLVKRCIEHHLVDSNISVESQDRAMRALIERARVDYTILNLSDGAGYYGVGREDLQDLHRYIKQEDNRAKSAFRNHSNAKKLYEDYKSGRI